MSELEEFRTEVRAWLEENRPAQPDFLLPETFMEVGTDAQFQYLRDWQQKVYEAGYLGMAWPKEYGGGGRPQAYQDIVNAEMARLKVKLEHVGLAMLTRKTVACGSAATSTRSQQQLGAEQVKSRQHRGGAGAWPA